MTETFEKAVAIAAVLLALCIGTGLIVSAARQDAPAQKVREALRPYCIHLTECVSWMPGGRCTCGLDEALGDSDD